MIPTLQIGGLGRIRKSITGAWTPANLTTPAILWSNDDSTATDAGSGACSLWGARQSGNAYDWVQGSGSARPLIVPAGLNGRRTIRFDGTSDAMAISGTGLSGTNATAIYQNTGSGWLFIVYKKSATDGSGTDRMIFNVTRGTDAATRLAVYASSTVNNNTPRLLARRLDADASGGLLPAATSPGTAWTMALVLMDWTNGDGFIYLNGSLDAQNLSITSSGSTSNTTSTLAPVLGAQSASALFANIEVAEVLAGRGLPSSPEIANLFAYAGNRWGL